MDINRDSLTKPDPSTFLVMIHGEPEDERFLFSRVSTWPLQSSQPFCLREGLSSFRVQDVLSEVL